MTISNKMWNGFLMLQRVMLFITSLTILLIIAVNVAMRYVFKIDFYGMEDIVLIAAWWCYFIGASYATYERSHLSAEIVSVCIKSEHVKAVIKLIVSVGIACLGVVFAYWGYIQLQWALSSRGTTTVLQLPLIVPQSAIIVGFFLIAFYSALNLVKDVREFLVFSKSNWIAPDKDEVS